MRLLVFGGTVFLSRAVAAEAIRRGHEVLCACRGTTNQVPAGATHVRLDRSADSLDAVAGAGRFDAVIDVARRPSWVRPAVTLLADAHWVFVSTISVYADPSLPGRASELPLLEPLPDAAEETGGPEAYGGLKVACERAVTETAASSTIVRPGLIVGPGDPSGRFSYWPARLAEPGPVLAPGRPEDPTQLIDVRDLAAYLVDCAERRTPGVLDGTGTQQTWGEFLAGVAEGVADQPPDLMWVSQEFLLNHEVAPWSGPNSLPVWVPQPDFAGLVGHDVSAALATGLRLRPLAETARDTLAWLRAGPDAATTGISRAREAELLAAWGQDFHPTGTRASY